ncbi:uncharacterized protein ALTATR162_LOCUS3119 [Alternaria atra]|uniref:Uncharacterized protein n=1 Tax=Alternaria atra TaxID=119953 RepID=A0A8J2MY08_9PLEO|nr:uncharacterized protein ALTATR162_LOCUS3119 [Alternaria atra]CAG5153299.1 unnamed protein product [Alternaria atra]
MAGRWQPYMYASQRDSMIDTDPTRSTFNPKAITMASRMPPPPPKKKQEGPLIDFNKHPDSYLILPYGNTNAKPMSPKTKVFIDIARWTQFSLRILTLLGAVGVLLCGIFIRGAQDTEGYILRIPPGVDLVVSLYAIYHLIRNPKTRPAGSSASYHFFALVTDAGFIPFYVFTVLMARRNSDKEAGTVGRWRTMFPTDGETNIVLMTTWITAIATGGLHLISAVIDMYLAILFRNISKLPPDMNPLEDNLTSRRKTKHKYKNSSISAIIPLTSDQEKRFSDQSTIAGDRSSKTPSYIYSDIPSPNKSQVAFMHTRTDSETTYSPHTPASARQSKERFSMYSQPPSAHQSRKELNHRDDLCHQDEDNQTLAQRKSMLSEQANIKRHSRTDAYITNSSKQDFHTPPATARSLKQEASGDLSLQRNSQQSLKNDNWFVHPEQEDEYDENHLAPAPKQSMFSMNGNKGYNTVSRYEDVSDVDDEAEEPMMPEPLRMNPLSQNPPSPLPSPPPTDAFTNNNQKNTPPPSGLQRTLTTTSISTEKTFDRSHSRSGTPKSRYYGNLKAATEGVRSANSPSNSPSASPTKGSSVRNPNHFPSATKQYAVNAPPPVPQHNLVNSPFTLHKKSYTSIKRTGEANYTPVKGQSPRVISRSGVDYINPYEFDDSDLGMPGRRRDVSGKIAEEGRGGGWSGMKQRTVSGVAQAY